MIITELYLNSSLFDPRSVFQKCLTLLLNIQMWWKDQYLSLNRLVSDWFEHTFWESSTDSMDL